MPLVVSDVIHVIYKDYHLSARCARPRRHTALQPTLSGQHGFLDRVSERIVMHALRTNDGVLKLNGRNDSVSI